LFFVVAGCFGKDDINDKTKWIDKLFY
jgi:hypothetical protein